MGKQNCTRILPISLHIAMIIVVITNTDHAIAKPCFPSDPTGSNVGNLCPEYPPVNLNQQTTNFVPGFATEGYYGTPVNSTLPGTPLNPNNPKDGFFTNIKTEGNTTTINTNTGKEWRFQAN